MALRKIGTVAREVGLSERRIREYGRAGLIRPRRQPQTGDRLFDETDVTQLRKIKALIHERGFTIEALQHLLRYAPCWELASCEHRDSCPVPRNPGVPCYEQRASGIRMPCSAECERCVVYQSKEHPNSAIVHRPTVRFPPN